MSLGLMVLYCLHKFLEYMLSSWHYLLKVWYVNSKEKEICYPLNITVKTHLILCYFLFWDPIKQKQSLRCKIVIIEITLIFLLKIISKGLELLNMHITGSKML